ncbi:hypothetical protein SAMN04487972_1518 [Paracoccus halophilus]|uniref:Uncharacterized protein n=2 Tax=Paracoccus halophilus TaxID=376733 RepID=A0A1I0UET8_9RHOB|nr:hypothetical protein SAMN04487972_1518 [Paracoccus halophilus]
MKVSNSLPAFCIGGILVRCKCGGTLIRRHWAGCSRSVGKGLRAMRDEPFSQAASEGSSTDLDPGERLARANALIEAALRCDWQDAEMVMSSLLEEYRAGPPMPALADIEDDAAFWAQMATFEELRAYFIACGQKLIRAGLGVRGRVKLARRVLSDLPPDQRRKALEILSADCAEGQGGIVHPRRVSGSGLQPSERDARS